MTLVAMALGNRFCVIQPCSNCCICANLGKAEKIASATVDRSVVSQSSDVQVDRLRGVDRAQQSDLASSAVEMAHGKLQLELGAKVAKASDEMLGTLIDTYA